MKDNNMASSECDFCGKEIKNSRPAEYESEKIICVPCFENKMKESEKK